jgi:hypothetical protein
MKTKSTILLSAVLLLFVAIAACKKDSSTSTTTNVAIPAIYQRIYGASSITNDGTYITIKTTDLPDHKSAYYAASNPLYQAFSGKTFGGFTFAINPNSIASQSITLKIPVNPAVSANHDATPLGVIGIALNGVALFNQYAGPNTPLTTEIVSFDQYWGHPQQQGVYHYHVEPIYLTQTKFSESALVGFLLDGFPVYGPQENGKTLTSADLDTYHGHTSATADYPNGIYHYHFTADAPYLNGSGFYGTEGTVSQ